MQRLVWQNANGDEINLTSGNYGITEWEGFSNAPLNIQSQQVPFEDGGIFLDALIEQRELSVTLKMQDNGNLEERYRMRRELIHALNPKLGEGYLIYTNDFISKRIKCTPQMPLFPTHNSNDSGTPSASLAWTACEPYWEDTEETEVTILKGERKIVKNEGDVPVNIKLNLYTDGVNTPIFQNLTTGKKIQLNGNIQNELEIDTNKGKKSVYGKIYKTYLTNYKYHIESICYSDKLNLFIFLGSATYISHNLKDWEFVSLKTGTRIFYCKEKETFFIIGSEGFISSSTDGINWTTQTSGTNEVLYGITYSDELRKYVVVGYNGTILTSSDGETWTTQTSGITDCLRSVIYAEDLHKFVAVGYNIVGDEEAGTEGVILTSTDGVTWAKMSNSNEGALYSVIYVKDTGRLYACGGDLVYSADGITWSGISDIGGISISYSEMNGTFIMVGWGYVYISQDGEYWNPLTNVIYSANEIIYVQDYEVFVVVGDYGEMKITGTGYEWESILVRNIFNIISLCHSDELGIIVGVTYTGDMVWSKDGELWELSASKSMSRVTYSKERKIFVAIGTNAVSCVSIDGRTWIDNQPPHIDCRFWDIKFVKDRFFAVGDKFPTSNDAIILTSIDGLEWTELSNAGNERLIQVVEVPSEYGDNVYFFGKDGVILRYDFYYDVQYVSSLEKEITSVAYSKVLEKFVLCAFDIASGYKAIIMTSYNAEDWGVSVEYSGIGRIADVTYSEERYLYMAVADNVLLVSEDGKTWVVSRISEGNLSIVTNISYLSKSIIVGIMGMYAIDVIIGNNEIAKISTDSDMNFKLLIGDNNLSLIGGLGNLYGKIKFRQKYLGV